MIVEAVLCFVLLFGFLLSKFPLDIYFGVSAASVAILTMLQWFGLFYSPWYTLAYAALSFPCLLIAGLLLFDILRSHKAALEILIASFALAMFFVIAAVRGRTLTLNDHVNVIIGWLSVGMGGAMGYGASNPYRPMRDRIRAYVLGATWIVQGVYLFGWTLHMSDPHWIWLNDWCMPLITIAGVVTLLCSERSATPDTQTHYS